MTEILECRWKCDFCGVVSPVLEYKADPMQWLNITIVPPIGWTNLLEPARTPEECYAWGGARAFVDRHFCCALHETLYKNKRAESAETPEEAKV